MIWEQNWVMATRGWRRDYHRTSLYGHRGAISYQRVSRAMALAGRDHYFGSYSTTNSGGF